MGDFKNSTSTPPPAKRLETSFSSPFPPQELNALGVTETGAEILLNTVDDSMPMGADKLRERLDDQEREEKAKKRAKMLKRKEEHERFLRR